MSFTSSDDPGNGDLAGQDLDAELYQDWSNQTVFSLGGAYQISDQWTLRGGFNYGGNPVPNSFLNCPLPGHRRKACHSWCRLCLERAFEL